MPSRERVHVLLCPRWPSGALPIGGGVCSFCRSRTLPQRQPLLHRFELLAELIQWQATGKQRVESGVGIDTAVERFIARAFALAPLVLCKSKVVPDKLLLRRQLLEVLELASQREVAVAGPLVFNPEPVVDSILRCADTHHEERRLVLPARLARPDCSLAGPALRRKDAPVVAVAGEAKDSGVLVTRVVARRGDPHLLAVLMRVRG